MNRGQVRRGRDASLDHLRGDTVAIRSLGQLHDVHEPAADVLRVVRERRLGVDAVQQLAVSRRHLPARDENRVEPFELRDPERGRDVVEAVVVAQAAVQEPGARFEPSLIPERHEHLMLFPRGGRHRPALAGRDLLVRIEGEHGRVPVRADRTAAVTRAEGLARVLDELQPVTLAQR